MRHHIISRTIDISTFSFFTPGTIDSDELGTVMRSMGLQPSDEDVLDMIREVGRSVCFSSLVC